MTIHTDTTNYTSPLDQSEGFPRCYVEMSERLISSLLTGTYRDGVGGTNPSDVYVVAALRHAVENLTNAITIIETGR